MPQDLPALGVGQQYAATLISTPDVLGAVQQAHQCRQGVLTGQTPVRQAADPLPPLPSADGDMALSLHPSPDPRYCATTYHRKGGPNAAQQIWVERKCGLALYDSHTGRLLHSLRSDDERGCRICWSACSTRLQVEVEAVDEECFLTNFVVIYEVPSGRIATPHWSPEAEAVLSDRSRIGSSLWGPDGKHFLVSTHSLEPRGPPEKMLHVLHAVTGALVASAAMTDVRCSKPCEVCMYLTPPVEWHPSSIGVVVPTCSWQMADLYALRGADLKVGLCHEIAHLVPQGTYFSPDGRHLVAPTFLHVGDGPSNAVAVMQCIEEAECLIFPLLHVLGDYDSPVSEARWCPRPGADADLLIRLRNALWLVTLDGHLLGQPASAEFCTRPDTTFSPCGRFCQVARREGNRLVPYILHTGTGAVHALPGSSSEVSIELLWSACGARILQQTTQVGSDLDPEFRWQSFAVLHYTAS